MQIDIEGEPTNGIVPWDAVFLEDTLCLRGNSAPTAFYQKFIISTGVDTYAPKFRRPGVG